MTPLAYIPEGQVVKQSLLTRKGLDDAVSHDVQFVLTVEHVRQGERQPKQVELTRNCVESRQVRQVAEDVQVPQGLTH